MLDWCESLTSLQPHSAILWPPCGKSKPNLEQCKVQQNTLEKFSSDELGQPCLKVIRALLNAMKVQKIEQNILNVNNCQTSKWMSEDLFFSLWFNVISETVYWFLCVYVLSGWHFYRSQQKTLPMLQSIIKNCSLRPPAPWFLGGCSLGFFNFVLLVTRLGGRGR